MAAAEVYDSPDELEVEPQLIKDESTIAFGLTACLLARALVVAFFWASMAS